MVPAGRCHTTYPFTVGLCTPTPSTARLGSAGDPRKPPVWVLVWKQSVSACSRCAGGGAWVSSPCTAPRIPLVGPPHPPAPQGCWKGSHRSPTPAASLWPRNEGCGSRGVPGAARRAAGDPAMSTVETAINKHGIAIWIPFPLPASAGAWQEPPRWSPGLDGVANATGAPHRGGSRGAPAHALLASD